MNVDRHRSVKPHTNPISNRMLLEIVTRYDTYGNCSTPSRRCPTFTEFHGNTLIISMMVLVTAFWLPSCAISYDISFMAVILYALSVRLTGNAARFLGQSFSECQTEMSNSIDGRCLFLEFVLFIHQSYVVLQNTAVDHQLPVRHVLGQIVQSLQCDEQTDLKSQASIPFVRHRLRKTAQTTSNSANFYRKVYQNDLIFAGCIYSNSILFLLQRETFAYRYINKKLSNC